MRKEEFWKDIVGYEGLYQVSNFGRVKSADRTDRYGREFKGKILTPCTDNLGYLHLGLQHDGKRKTVRVHRLVAEAFIPNTNNCKYINHKDENKQNNCVGNLEWCDTKYNINYGRHNEKVAKSHCKKVYCVELDKEFKSAKSAAAQLNLSDSNIAKCCKGKYKTTGGYHWKYA